MTTVSDIITWVRRLIKSPNPQSISDATILEYLNRFYMYDVPYRIQQFELKTNYTFETAPNIDRYNLPIDTYNSILTPLLIDNVPGLMSQSVGQFQNLYPLLYFNAISSQGDGINIVYNFFIAQSPLIRGHRDVLGNLSPSVYVTAQDAADTQMELQDDGAGNLINADTGAPAGSVNYLTGEVFAIFPNPVAAFAPINTQSIPYQAGRPVCVLFYNNVFTVRPVPDRAYLLQFDAYLTPSAFLNSGQAVTFNWMADYLAHGTARRILKDLGDSELIEFNEPFFREQERQVLRRTTRQNENVRTATIYVGQGLGGYGGPYPGGY